MKKLVILLFILLIISACQNNKLEGRVILEKPSGVIKTFKDNNNPVCKLDNKPIVRVFSTSWCPHCKWITETYKNVMKEYTDKGKIIAYNWEIDTGDDLLTDEQEEQVPPSELAVYKKFNPKGSVPTFIFGCRYYRIGNGFEGENDLAAEESEFRAVLDKIIGAK